MTKIHGAEDSGLGVHLFKEGVAAFVEVVGALEDAIDVLEIRDKSDFWFFVLPNLLFSYK